LEKAFDKQSARPRDLLRFKESLDIDLLVLPSTVFDPLWLHRDRKDRYGDAPFDEFEDFFSTDYAPKGPNAHQSFFPGAFAYQWHGCWQAPEVRESWFGALEAWVDDIVADKYEPRYDPVPAPPLEDWKVDLDRFHADGYVGPVKTFAEGLCSLIARYAASNQAAEPADWPKGRAVSDRFFYDIATQPRLLAVAKSILGEDVILWGVSIVRRGRGKEHPWHVDIESTGAAGGFLSVWIGLQNTSVDSSLRLIPRSHRFGSTLQAMAAEKGFAYGGAGDEQVLAWARELDPGAEIVAPAEVNGDAVFFDGRLWHGARTPQDHGQRVALLLQYATAGVRVRMRAKDSFEWPFRYSQHKPPVLLISGQAPETDNRIVPPPPPCGSRNEGILTNVTPIQSPLQEEPRSGWKPYHFFRGPTPVVDVMSCHASVLSPGRCPHPPHAHLDEELLMVLDGEAEVVIADTPDKPRRTEMLKPGLFIYYPALQHHTIRNRSQRPVTYLMFKWRAAPTELVDSLAMEITSCQNPPRKTFPKPRDTWLLFEGPTAYLGKLHAHLTELQPGAGYAPHRDPYDVAIVLLEGTIATLGETLSSPAVVYCAADEPHGMHNPGETTARYLVFEFHPAAPLPA
jgi:mannose-6-phosphate isomerase-like protein (cupin superfamily)